MNTYNGFSVRSSFTAAFCAVLFSAACLVGTLAPAPVSTATAHVIVA